MEISCSTLFKLVDKIEEDPEPVYFFLAHRIVGTTLLVPILIFGPVRNILVVLVVAKSRSLCSSTYCYLVSLAIVDCIVWMATVPQEIVSYYLLENEWVWGDIGCSLSVFWQNLGITVSFLSLVAATVERWVQIKIKQVSCAGIQKIKCFFFRYLATCKPNLTQLMCTICSALRTVYGYGHLLFCSRFHGYFSLLRSQFISKVIQF